jgi:HSP20 family protein
MTLVRFGPAREPSTVQQQMNRLFGSLAYPPAAAPAAAPSRPGWVPAVDVVETADEYLFRADLPGLGSDDVKIEVDANVLTISGERDGAQEPQEGGYRKIERASGAFARSLRLPRGTDPTAISAHFADGVLEVHIPRPERSQPWRVAIDTDANAAPASVAGSEDATEVAAAA